MDKARLIVDQPAEGGWNMAVDQALLETTNQTGLTTLRFYQWSRPTLSLGYFQNHDDRRRHSASTSCPLIRRRTGGGAILHDQELTYSLCVPNSQRWSKHNSELYDSVHRILIEILAQSGAEATLYRERSDFQELTRGRERKVNSLENEPRPLIDQHNFMCFHRRSPGDVVLDGYKIIGSAQRRLKNALLQHGSILMARSQFAPELPGINELCGFPVGLSKTVEKFSAFAKNRLRIDPIVGKLSQHELDTSKLVYSTMFGNESWNLRR